MQSHSDSIETYTTRLITPSTCHAFQLVGQKLSWEKIFREMSLEPWLHADAPGHINLNLSRWFAASRTEEIAAAVTIVPDETFCHW